MNITRRQFLASVAAAGASFAIYGTEFERNRMEISQREIRLARLPEPFEGFRIAQLSDFHYHEFLSDDLLDYAVRRTNELAPDVVALTGDFVTEPFFAPRKKAAADHARPCAEHLSRLSCGARFSVLGNHDYMTDPGLVAEALNQTGSPVLKNTAVALERGGSRLWIAGLDNVSYRRANPSLSLRGIPPGEPVVLLVHEPDIAVVTKNFPVDLQLSGHSHGGQVCAPWGPMYLPPFARMFPSGLYRVGKMLVYTNRGLGTTGVPVRVLCPPEITLFTLRRDASGDSSLSL